MLASLFAGSLFCCAVLGSVGIYVGRFVRANSWDFLTNPHLFARLAHARLADPLGNPKLFAVTLLFTAVLSFGYVPLYNVASLRLELEPERGR